MRLRLGTRGVLPLLLLLLIGLLSAPPALAADVNFDPPTATARLGSALSFRTTFRSTAEPRRVELLSRLPGQPGLLVQQAKWSRDGGRYTASLDEEKGHTLPNTTLVYRFRVVLDDGERLGPEARVTVVDDRFSWQVLEGRLVRLHWYEGDEAFAKRALAVGEGAVEKVSRLLGVTESERIDFFVYASEGPFREALGPGTRENVGGQANASIRTLFALIEPSQIGSDWIDVVIPHELTHLVFNTAVENPYHFPPRWLNEGLAEYLSGGYKPADRARVRAAASEGRIIPLDGLAGQFPTDQDGFYLAYAESVSAVDHFIRHHGQDTLVKLVKSYSAGVTDDEAFSAATGGNVATFQSDWLKELHGLAPSPYGPRPGLPGPLPPDWTGPEQGVAQPSAGASDSSSAASRPNGAGASSSPEAPGAPADTGEGGGVRLPPALVGAVLGGLGALVLLARSRRRGATRGRDAPPAP